MRLSPHFTLAELTVTTRPDSLDVDGDGDRTETIPNEPGATERAALTSLCDRVLEPVRSLLGVPLKITSGFRSDAVNAAVGGEPKSQHRLGRAADVVPMGMPAEAAMRRIHDAVKTQALTVDQAIIYPSGFIHLSWSPRPRNMLLRSAAPRGSRGPYSAYVVPSEGP